MNLYSVTIEFEDDREGQWTYTFAILATSKAEAVAFTREYAEDAYAIYPSDALTVRANGLWKGKVEPVVYAQLTERNGAPFLVRQAMKRNEPRVNEPRVRIIPEEPHDRIAVEYQYPRGRMGLDGGYHTRQGRTMDWDDRTKGKM